MSPRRGAVALALLALLVGGCGKEAPKTDAATQRKEALERSKEGAFGTQVKALEDAKSLGAELDKKARESLEKAEQGTK